ncbi:hypothetical protein DFJ74DRAFT_677787 [Hyaloraphidium curvatum]|nr:hypothetical protein DFJ74DRAFT_677787 [Hyaloraphidium curvatum]
MALFVHKYFAGNPTAPPHDLQKLEQWKQFGNVKSFVFFNSEPTENRYFRCDDATLKAALQEVSENERENPSPSDAELDARVLKTKRIDIRLSCTLPDGTVIQEYVYTNKAKLSPARTVLQYARYFNKELSAITVEAQLAKGAKPAVTADGVIAAAREKQAAAQQEQEAGEYVSADDDPGFLAAAEDFARAAERSAGYGREREEEDEEEYGDGFRPKKRSLGRKNGNDADGQQLWRPKLRRKVTREPEANREQEQGFGSLADGDLDLPPPSVPTFAIPRIPAISAFSALPNFPAVDPAGTAEREALLDEMMVTQGEVAANGITLPIALQNAPLANASRTPSAGRVAGLEGNDDVARQSREQWRRLFPNGDKPSGEKPKKKTAAKPKSQDPQASKPKDPAWAQAFDAAHRPKGHKFTVPTAGKPAEDDKKDSGPLDNFLG